MSKFYNYLLSFLLLSFVLLFIMLSWNSRLATDDYWFIWNVRNNGIIQNVHLQYMEWCGRYSSTCLIDVIFKLFDTDQRFYFLLPLISFIFLLSGMYFIIKLIFNYMNIKLQFISFITISLCFISLLFFMSFDIGETARLVMNSSRVLASFTDLPLKAAATRRNFLGDGL